MSIVKAERVVSWAQDYAIQTECHEKQGMKSDILLCLTSDNYYIYCVAVLRWAQGKNKQEYD
jgi:hypothetical protein